MYCHIVRLSSKQFEMIKIVALRRAIAAHAIAGRLASRDAADRWSLPLTHYPAYPRDVEIGRITSLDTDYICGHNVPTSVVIKGFKACQINILLMPNGM